MAQSDLWVPQKLARGRARRPAEPPLQDDIADPIRVYSLRSFATEFRARQPCHTYPSATWITQTNEECAMTHDIVRTSAADALPPFNPGTFWPQFRHDTVTVKGVRLHFVEGGSGAPILPVPG
jgi:hypothetical protein